MLRIPNRPQVETLVGRSLAICVHPSAAWRSRSARRRLFVFSAYAVASYAFILGILVLMAS